MYEIILPNTSVVSDGPATGSFTVGPLYPGYGSTLGNALRRILLSSLEGAAVDSVEITGVEHEFSTIPHVKEDVIAIILNLKQLRFDLQADSAELTLKVSGKKQVTGADFAKNADCSVLSTDMPIATIEDGGTLEMRIRVVRGRGYEPVERKTEREKVIGRITVDSIFSPVIAVAYRVESARVGQMTNYDSLVLDITTDGSITPANALNQAARILTEQAAAIAGASVEEIVGDMMNPVEEVAAAESDDDAVSTLSESTNLDPKTKIEDAGFSSRTANALVAAGYKTLAGLRRLSDLKLEGIKGLGLKGIEEVKAVLDQLPAD